MSPPNDRDAEGHAGSGPVGRSGSRFRDRLLPVLRVVLAMAILIALVSWTGPAEVVARLAGFPLPQAAGCLLLALVGQTLGALRLGLLARSQQLPMTTGEALGINLAAVFYGLILPGGNATGWAVRLLRISAGPGGVAAAILVLATDRALATAAGAGIGSLTDGLLGGPASIGVSLTFLGVTAAAGVLAWALLTSRLDELLARARRLPGVGGLVPPSGRRGRLPRRTAPQIVLAGLGLSLVLHVLGVAIWAWLASSLGIGVGVLTIAWVRSAGLIAGLLPITVGGLGLREGTVVYLLMTFGVGGADALSLSLVAFAVTVLAIGAIGGLCEAVRLLLRARP